MTRSIVGFDRSANAVKAWMPASTLNGQIPSPIAAAKELAA